MEKQESVTLSLGSSYIHTDINGPMEVASLKGMHYIACFIGMIQQGMVLYTS